MRRGLLILWLLLAGCSATSVRETLHPHRGMLEESFTEEAVTRPVKTWPVRMPAAGRLARIELEPGDPVRRNQALATFDRLPAQLQQKEAEALVEERRERLAVARTTAVEEAALRQAQAQLPGAREGLSAALARREQARIQARQANLELKRSRQLFAQDAIPKQRLELDEAAARTAHQEVAELNAQVREQQAQVDSARQQLALEDARLQRRSLESQVLRNELNQASTRQAQAAHEVKQQVLRSPIDGVVLERYEQGPGYFEAGTRLLLLANPRQLEVRAEVLTEDALRLKTGLSVRLEPAPGRAPLSGQVLRIEPAGFTKLSSLGVEQRRVNVIVRLTGTLPGLGPGYRLRARFIVGQRQGVLLVPRAAVLQKPDRSYYVLKVIDGRLSEQPVEIGLKGDMELEITRGVSESDELVALPETTMRDGDRVNTP